MNLEKELGEINLHWHGEKMAVWKYRREVFEKIWKDRGVKLMALITGMRRIGKSVVCKQLVDGLVVDGVEPQQILFWEFRPGDTQKELIAVWQYYYDYVANLREKVYVFFDEIQYVDDYEIVLKNWYDRYEQVKFFLTGSFSLLSKPKTRDSLAGRYWDYRLMPLSFKEYLEMSGRGWPIIDGDDKWKLEGMAREFNHDFRKFLRYGRFPETLSMTEDQTREYARATKIQMVSRDVPDYFEVRRLGLLINIFEYITENSGGEISGRSLAQKLGENQLTVNKYLEVLSIMGLVYLVANTTNPLKVGNMNRKAYASSALTEGKEADNLGTLVESYVLERLLTAGKKVTYYRWRNQEIDFLVPKERLAVEVKYRWEGIGTDRYRQIADKLGYKLLFLTLDRASVDDVEALPVCWF